jgi:hypothetical protein
MQEPEHLAGARSTDAEQLPTTLISIFPVFLLVLPNLTLIFSPRFLRLDPKFFLQKARLPRGPLALPFYANTASAQKTRKSFAA